MSDITDLSDCIVAKSDQLNAVDIIGTKILKITSVKRQGQIGAGIVIDYEGSNGRPYKPCKNMMRLIMSQWGSDGSNFIGRYLLVYCDNTVIYGGKPVGGIRIHSMSHIEQDFTFMQRINKTLRVETLVKKLAENFGIDTGKRKKEYTVSDFHKNSNNLKAYIDKNNINKSDFKTSMQEKYEVSADVMLLIDGLFDEQ